MQGLFNTFTKARSPRDGDKRDGPVIFLDVDGVLNSQESRESQPDQDVLSAGLPTEEHLASLASIAEGVRDFGPLQVVLSSTWRLELHTRVAISRSLESVGLAVFDSTPDLEATSQGDRVDEIVAWLASAAGRSSSEVPPGRMTAKAAGTDRRPWCAIDDLDLLSMNAKLERHQFVRTDDRTGLTRADGAKAVSQLRWQYEALGLGVSFGAWTPAEEVVHSGRQAAEQTVASAAAAALARADGRADVLRALSAAGFSEVEDSPGGGRQLVAGAKVVVQGLVSRPELNGCEGVVLGTDEATGRYKVKVKRLEGDEDVKLKPACVAPAGGSAAGSGGGPAAVAPAGGGGLPRIPPRVLGMSADPTAAWQVASVTKSQAGTRALPLQDFTSGAGPPRADCVRFVAISDTHSAERRRPDKPLAVPEGDVLLHAGDFSQTGDPREVCGPSRRLPRLRERCSPPSLSPPPCQPSMRQVESFCAWFGSLPHPRKILIAGNHDLTLHAASYGQASRLYGQGHAAAGWGADQRALCERARAAIQAIPNCEYLEDAGTSVRGVRVWGSPWQPEFCEWAFNLPRGAPCREKWALIPEGTDVVMTHGPPLGHGDLCASGHRAGCLDLLDELQSRVRPRYHVFGHIHEGYGASTDGQTTYLNASSCTLQYRPDHAALVFDVPARE